MAIEFNPGDASNLNDAVKKRYEGNPNTNAYTDAEKLKLSGVSANANMYTHPNHFGDVVSTGDGQTTVTNNAITYAKFQQAAAGYTIIAKPTTGAGNFSGLVASTNGVLRRDGSGDLAFGTLVTGNYGDSTVTLAKLPNVSAGSVIGRSAAGSGVLSALSNTQLTTLINTFSSSTAGVVPASGGGANNFLRADGTWAVPAGGGGGGGDWDDLTSLSAKTTLNSTDKYPCFDAANSDVAVYKTEDVLRSGLAASLITINAQTAAYTLVLADASKLVTMNVASANQLTIPTNASVAYPVGTVIVIQQIGAGVTTVKGATGVTLNGVSAGGGAITARWAACSIVKSATNTWLAMGGIGAVA